MIYVRVEFASRRFPDVKMGIYFSLNQIREKVAALPVFETLHVS